MRRFLLVLCLAVATGLSGLPASASATDAAQASSATISSLSASTTATDTSENTFAYAAWQAWTPYSIGDRVSHNGVDYECIQAHTSQPGWEPSVVPALWKRIGSSDPGEPGAPGAPTNARVTGSTAGSISLAWNAPGGTVTGYRVYEGSTQRAQVSGTSATLSGLGACTSHTYTVRAYNGNGESAASNQVTGTTSGCSNPGRMAGAPYLYMGWGNPPDPGTVMDATGVRSFTMAFILSSGGCTPAWDGQRPLTGGVDQQAINAIKAKGGNVQVSFGGWSGNKLGPNCSTPQAYANAVQQVINAVGPAVVDFDIENYDEFENYTVQDRILNALTIVKSNNPNVKVVVTFGTTTSGPNSHGVRLINRARQLGVPIDNFTIMPFDFGGGANMYQNTVNASEGLKNALKSAYGWSDARAYAHMGISGMNGLSDQQELTSVATWTQIRDWAVSRGLTRLAYWSVNRDRPCPGGGVRSDCSGISQNNWDFTRVTATF